MRRFPPGDWLIGLAVLAVIIYISAAVYGGSSEAAPVLRIQVEDRVWVYDLAEDREIEVPGPLGTTEVHIEGGEVYVHESPCKEKICIAAGRISRPNEWIVCLPNRVFITILGERPEEQEVDEVVF